MQEVFKGKFLESLVKAHDEGNLRYPGDLEPMTHPVYFADFIDKSYRQQWIIYAKKPFAGPAQVLEYIGRYTHRVAISNHRIISVSNNEICFKYKDYRDKSKNKVMKLPPVEFIRRYLQHILPPRFVKIRHGGFQAGGYKKDLLALACKLIKKVDKSYQVAKSKLKAVSERIAKQCIVHCPVCLIGQLRYQEGVFLQLPELIEEIR